MGDVVEEGELCRVLFSDSNEPELTIISLLFRSTPSGASLDYRQRDLEVRL